MASETEKVRNDKTVVHGSASLDVEEYESHMYDDPTAKRVPMSKLSCSKVLQRQWQRQIQD